MTKTLVGAAGDDDPENVEQLLELSAASPDVVELATVTNLNVSPQVGVEFGVTNPLPGIGGFEDFYGLSMTGEIPRTGLVSLDNLVLMLRKDGQARSMLRLLTLPIRKALKESEWVAPEDLDDAEGDADEEVTFANQMWNLPPQSGGMTVPVSKFLRQTLLALAHGYSCFEEVRHVPEKGPLRGLITLRKMALRDARSIKFKVDDSGGFNGFQQRASVNGKSVDVWIKPGKAWYYAVNEEENPYYGVSMFEAAHQHYEIKRKLYYIAHLAAQFAAIPARVGEVPPNFTVGELNAFKRALMDFAANTAMTHPAGYKVTMQNSTGNFDFLKLIDHHNHMMSKSVLAGFIDSENRPALVDINDGDPQADMFVVALEALMNEIAESWTQHIMPKYIDWNFGTDKYPVFKFGALSDDDKGALTEAFTSIVSSSTLNCTPEFVREVEKKLATRLNLDVDYDAIEKMEEEIQAEAKEQQQAQAEAQAQAQTHIDEMQPPMPPGAPGQPGRPVVPGTPGKQPPQLIAASQDDLDELVTMAQQLLTRHLDEDFSDG